MTTELELTPIIEELELLKTDFSKNRPHEAAMVMVQNVTVDKCISVIRQLYLRKIIRISKITQSKGQK